MQGVTAASLTVSFDLHALTSKVLENSKEDAWLHCDLWLHQVCSKQCLCLIIQLHS